MTLTVVVNDVELTIDASTTVAQLFARLHPDLDPAAAGNWLLARADDANFVLNPQRMDLLVTYLFDDGEPVPLRLERPPHCRHGSPEVPGRGFLCGWC